MTYKPDVCIYHANCNDGFGAAWAVHLKWPDVQFVPASYGDPLPDGIDDRHVMIVDFSYSREMLLHLGSRAASVVVLDHHKTAQEALAPFAVTMFEDSAFTDENVNLVSLFDAIRRGGNPPVLAYFNMNKSGARLAWEFCYDSEPPELIRHIEDRDLWRFELPLTKEIHVALRSYERDFVIWDALSKDIFPLYQEGLAILRAEHAILEGALQNAYTMTVDEFTVPALNILPRFASDAAHRLLNLNPDAPFAATWSRGKDGEFWFSLRSEDSRQDVSAIAKRFGGGGHRNAAGFSITPAVSGTAINSDEYRKAAN